MKRQRLDGQETRKKLLAAASEFFAKKGFWETTNADICQKAGVNTASVNYHFGSKENLYVQAWKFAFDESISKYPPDGNVSSEASAEEKFKANIKALINRVIDTESYDFDILYKETANPTGLLSSIMEENIQPIEDYLKIILAELLGDKANEELINLCHMSVMTQCFGPLLHIRNMKNDEKPSVLRPRELKANMCIETLSEHVVKFSLAGIKSYSNKQV